MWFVIGDDVCPWLPLNNLSGGGDPTGHLSATHPLFRPSSLCCCMLLLLCLFVVMFVACLLLLLWSRAKEYPYNPSYSVSVEKRSFLLWALLLVLELLYIVCV